MSATIRNWNKTRVAVKSLFLPVVLSLAIFAFHQLQTQGLTLLLAMLATEVLVVLTIVLFERLTPHNDQWNVSQEDGIVDIKHSLTVVGVSVFVIAAVGTLVSTEIELALWPTTWPVALQVALALVIFEFVDYWIHRAQHAIPILWRFHAVHHSVERLYWLNTFRFHIFDVLLKVIFGYGLLFLMGIELVTFAYFGLIVFTISYLQHCNVTSSCGPLNWLVATPELHRWHHSKLTESNNFGQVLIVWDIVFGTRFLAPQEDMRIGLSSPANFPKGYYQQLVAPFSRALYEEK